MYVTVANPSRGCPFEGLSNGRGTRPSRVACCSCCELRACDGARVAQYAGLGLCIMFNTVLFLFCVLIRGVLLPGGEGGGVPTATGVPSEYNTIVYICN